MASLLTVVILGGCGGGDDDKKQADTNPFVPATTSTPDTTVSKGKAATTTVPRGEVKTADGKTRKATFTDARKAVDSDQFAEAERVLPALRPAQRVVVRKRIANRLAREAREALRDGNRSLVLSLLGRAKKYPPTDLTRAVTAEYVAAEKALAARDRQEQFDRRDAARRRRAKAAAERAAEIARKAQQQAEQQQNKP
jgi:hypothetical protein